MTAQPPGPRDELPGLSTYALSQLQPAHLRLSGSDFDLDSGEGIKGLEAVPEGSCQARTNYNDNGQPELLKELTTLLSRFLLDAQTLFQHSENVVAKSEHLHREGLALSAKLQTLHAASDAAIGIAMSCRSPIEENPGSFITPE